MPTVNFYLKNYIDADGASLLYAQVVYANQRFRFSLSHRLLPSNWDRKKQRMKGYTETTRQMNDFLAYVEDKLQSVYLDLQRSGNMRPTPDEYKAAFFASTTEKREELKEIFESYIHDRRSVLSTDQIAQHSRAFERLVSYAESLGRSLQLADLSESIYNGFVAAQTGSGMLNNSVGQYIKHLRTFFAWARRKGYKMHPETELWKKLTETVQIITLSESEVEAIESADLSSIPHLDRTRTLFLLECYSGLRWSDASKVTASAVHDGFLHIDVQKTSEPLRIPITAPLERVLRKIIDGKVKPISAQKFNGQIKDMCQLAGLNSKVKQVRHSGKERITGEFEKWQLVTSHTGRRTFVTLSLQKGMRPEVVMKITGHKDIQTMMKYVNIVGKTAEKEMKEAWG